MAAILIAAKDLHQRMRDRTVIIVGLVLPFALAGILGATQPNLLIKGNTRYKFGVVNEDHGATALFFTKEVLGPLQSKKLIQLYPTSLTTGRALVRDGKAAATLVVPAGFSTATSNEASTYLEIVGNGGLYKQIGPYVAHSIALSFANQINGVHLAVVSARKQHSTSSEVIHLGEHASELPKRLKIQDVALPSKELDLKTREAAGMTILFLFFTVQFGFSTIIDERNHGTLVRLLAAPVSRRSIVFGKLLTSVALGLLSSVVLALATTLVFGAHWTNGPGVALLIFAGTLAATAMAACITTFVQTSEQAGLWQMIIAALIGGFGGAMFPVSQAGGALAFISMLTPHAQFLRGLGLLSHGSGLAAVLPMVEAILAFAAVLGIIAWLRIRRLLEV